MRRVVGMFPSPARFTSPPSPLSLSLSRYISARAHCCFLLPAFFLEIGATLFVIVVIIRTVALVRGRSFHIGVVLSPNITFFITSHSFLSRLFFSVVTYCQTCVLCDYIRVVSLSQYDKVRIRSLKYRAIFGIRVASAYECFEVL